jgi:hypothetical protein
MSDESIGGLDGSVIDVGGGVTGRPLEGHPTGGLGLVFGGRPANPADVALAARYWPQADPRDFYEQDGAWIDRASGAIYERLGNDPILGRDLREEDVSLFVVSGGLVVFLRATGSTVAEVEAATAERERALAQAEADLVAWRAKQRQVPLRFDELPDRWHRSTLRAAAARIEGVGGKIERGKYGLKITIPQRITRDVDALAALAEKSARETAAIAAASLVAAEAFVLATLDGLADARKPTSLAERLPDEVPVIGART